MQVRELAVGDAAEYTALRLRILREYSEAFTSSFEEDSVKPLVWAQQRLAPSKDAPHGFVLGAFTDDGVLIGSVGLAVEARTKQRHKALLFGMYVAPEQMSRGVGPLCWTPVSIARAAIPGLEQINLTVTTTNARALLFYEAAGFRTFGVEERALKIDGAYYPKAHVVLYLERAGDRRP